MTQAALPLDDHPFANRNEAGHRPWLPVNDHLAITTTSDEAKPSSRLTVMRRDVKRGSASGQERACYGIRATPDHNIAITSEADPFVWWNLLPPK